MEPGLKADRRYRPISGQRGGGGGGGAPARHFVYVSMYLPRCSPKVTPQVHIGLADKVYFHGLLLKSKTRPDLLHIHTFELLL